MAVTRCGSFSRAADELGYTQSAVSQHIAALESDLGTPLLSRRPVQPTAAGRRLLEHAGPILVRLAAARAEITRMTQAPPDRLVVGVSPLAFVPEVVGANHVRVLPRVEVVTGVAQGTLDLGLVDGITAPSDPLNLPDVAPLAKAGVAERPLAVVLPADHPLAGRKHVKLADLADAQWIDAPESAIPLAQLRAASGTTGFRAALRYEGTHVPGLLEMATAGHGLALLPQTMVGGLPAVPVTRLVHRVERLTMPTQPGSGRSGVR
ncbi:LysR family transcriptional regulator [Kibdelosporangium persicum]